ncbi:hypothetical protein TBK1r_75640 [Stieleria magnilauensis]|uniref:DUF4332 domain-containing protein n=1 Tax=Stieleria magnilauensis TaxID=2527963 RepID=A0ABX5Y2M4_9BACT|nr:hypothetical protein TBK1r_75640 [Planctomycetes bacterium TBK1r]
MLGKTGSKPDSTDRGTQIGTLSPENALQIIRSDERLASLVERWPDLPEDAKQAIINAENLSSR